MAFLRVLVAIVVLAVPLSAAAQSAPFFWMGDLVPDRRVGAEFGFGTPRLGVTDVTALFTDVKVNVAINRTVSVYGHLPLAFAFFETPVVDDDTGTALGNITIGVRGHNSRRLGRGSRLRLGGGLGFYLPTAPSGGDGGATAGAMVQLYLPNRGLWLPDTFTIRGGGDLRIETGVFFFQSEIDLDLHFTDGDDDVDMVVGIGPGVAITREFAALLELMISDITDGEDVTLDVGFRYMARALMVGVRVYIPLDDPYRDNDVIGAAVEFSGRF